MPTIYQYKDFTIKSNDFLGSESFYIYLTDSVNEADIVHKNILYLSNDGKIAKRDAGWAILYMFSLDEVEDALSIFYESPITLPILRTEKEVL